MAEEFVIDALEKQRCVQLVCELNIMAEGFGVKIRGGFSKASLRYLTGCWSNARMKMEYARLLPAEGMQ